MFEILLVAIAAVIASKVKSQEQEIREATVLLLMNAEECKGQISSRVN